MIDVRKFASLGHADHGWLQAAHHFSFASYHNADRMCWGSLRVWNDDAIAPGAGFPPHPHRDMEIITYVREGAVTHRDSLGNYGRTSAGDVQVMSAGTGVTHSEFNLEDKTTRLFQIWILPDRSGYSPTWGTRPFPKEAREGKFVALASGFAKDSKALPIHSASRVLGLTLKKGQSLTHRLTGINRAYLVPATGRVTVNKTLLNARDGAAIADLNTLQLTALEDTELVLVEMEA